MLEQDVITGKLKEEGISEILGNGLTFETDADLGVWVDAYKSGLPTQNKALNEYTKEELEEIAKDPQFKGAKGLQGLLDAARQKAKPTPTPIATPILKSDEPPEWAKLLIEDNQKLKSANAAKDFDTLLKTVGDAEGLSEIHISRVKKGLKSDATEGEIKTEVADYKKELTAAGALAFGSPESGGANNYRPGESLSAKYAEKYKKKQETKR